MFLSVQKGFSWRLNNLWRKITRKIKENFRDFDWKKFSRLQDFVRFIVENQAFFQYTYIQIFGLYFQFPVWISSVKYFPRGDRVNACHEILVSGQGIPRLKMSLFQLSKLGICENFEMLIWETMITCWNVSCSFPHMIAYFIFLTLKINKNQSR